MGYRVGLGPVFAFEWLMGSRRWTGYAMRSLTVVPLLGAMALAWYGSSVESDDATIAQQAEVGKTFYEMTSVLLLGLVGLASPAATAGAICQDKARGNLTLLFATNLSDAEVVLGKLAARLVPVMGMILSAAPVLAIATFFGGIDPVGLVGTLLVVVSCAIFGCSLAITLSVWGRKTHEVLMASYAFGILYLLAAPIWLGIKAVLPPSWWAWWFPSFYEILGYNPIFLVLAAGGGAPPPFPRVTIGAQARFLGLGLAAASVLIGLATWRIRKVATRQFGRSEHATRRGSWQPRRWVRMTSLDRNPVLWRECQRKRPSRWSLAVWGIYALVFGGFSVFAIVQMIHGQPLGRAIGVMINGVQVMTGLLLLSASASTSLAEERQRGSLDVLMATPLPTRSIVWAKWWGAFRAVPPLLILPVVVTASLAFHSGRFWGVALMAGLILSYGAAITSLGLALATWIPRMGRSAALTVMLYLFMSIVWIPLSLILFGEGPGDKGIGVGAGSPLMGVAVFSTMLAPNALPHELRSQTAWTLFWTIAYSGVALILLFATLGTFNRCLGRIDADSSGGGAVGWRRIAVGPRRRPQA